MYAGYDNLYGAEIEKKSLVPKGKEQTKKEKVDNYQESYIHDLLSNWIELSCYLRIYIYIYFINQTIFETPSTNLHGH